jgi:hypothetical protein
MPSRINSTTTSPGGLISTGDSDNSLLIQTGDTTAITISSSQQVTLTNPLPVGSGGTGGTTGLTALNASNLTSGTVPDARFPATLPAVSGANLTSLNASSVSSGTLAVARGGTGTASPSLVGGTNITISGTWPNQTVTAAGGGVTSLNGQTGAITNTDYGAIGSYVIAYGATSVGYTAGSTIAGSSLLRAAYLGDNPSDAGGLNVYTVASAGGGTTTTTTIITGAGAWSRTGLGLSGTWRSMTNSGVAISGGNQQNLWVRIS